MANIDLCQVKLRGELVGEPVLVVDRTEYSIYEAHMTCVRYSGAFDNVVLNIKECDIETEKSLIGSEVIIDGVLRTYKNAEGRSRTVVLVYSIIPVDENSARDINTVNLEGTIVSLRNTVGRNRMPVCEARVEIRGKYDKMSHVTVVGWGGTADMLNKIGSGNRITATGRVQTRHMVGVDGNVEDILEVAARSVEARGEAVSHDVIKQEAAGQEAL